ncbi:MAG: gliding-motility protein MglA [bacterium (Candidatus Stahlbacteria) CG23_combo_of_CG06-09_8_20_14_all_34_7]|nr:MAG: gliding-motility protein MglA [bacterium (Candidatus Stahlbacteria) CG23_combo_of_CG06-09_8_20_14_all_34_7]
MSVINYSSREITFKIVFYGTGLGGKTTNLKVIYNKVSPDQKGKMISLATEMDRTLFFDFLPMDIGSVKGFKTKFQLYTVPGQIYYNASRKLILKGVDGIVFVADSQVERFEDNIESMDNLLENLQEHNLKIEDIPFVLQYNKRDLPNISSLDDLQKSINPWNVPYFEAVATQGIGVFETLKAVSKMILQRL